MNLESVVLCCLASVRVCSFTNHPLALFLSSLLSLNFQSFRPFLSLIHMLFPYCLLLTFRWKFLVVISLFLASSSLPLLVENLANWSLKNRKKRITITSRLQSQENMLVELGECSFVEFDAAVKTDRLTYDILTREL